jgi:hypothetical protein
MDKYLIIIKRLKGSGHNEHHEKVNKCKTLADKDTKFEEKHPTPTDCSVQVASRFLIVTAGF